MIIQSHSFVAPKEQGFGSKIVAGVLVGSALVTGAFAEDPAWYTSLTTQLTSISGYVIAVLGSVVLIRLAPLAWTHVKSVLYR